MQPKNYSKCKNHGYTENVVKITINRKNYYRCKICLYDANNFSRKNKKSKAISGKPEACIQPKVTPKKFYKPCYVQDIGQDTGQEDWL